MRPPLRSRPGFTLIEIMIVVAIIAIIASVAIPRYYYFQLHTKRAEAYVQLGTIRASEEAFLASYDNYAACAPTPAVLPGMFKTAWVPMPCPPGCSALNPAVCTTFECIGFRSNAAVFFQYTTGALLSPAVNPTPEYAIGALSDLDDDGAVGSFSIQSNNTNNPANPGQTTDGLSACPLGVEANIIVECVPLVY
ncbi:MAG: prepilin-type N-terminal cleavage/methylation domain-containing protein [Myxococcota bacterium]